MVFTLNFFGSSSFTRFLFLISSAIDHLFKLMEVLICFNEETELYAAKKKCASCEAAAKAKDAKDAKDGDGGEAAGEEAANQEK